MLMVDEAHATGVYGATGRGMAQELGCEEGIHISVGTLSKALGSMGGFVSGQRSLIDLLVNKARTYIYSTAMPAACALAGIRAIDLLQSESQRRKQLFDNVDYITSRLVTAGLISQKKFTQIVPVLIGTPEATVAKSQALLNAGFYIPAIRPPTVPEGESLLRISLSSAHTVDQMEKLVAVLSQ